jgi:ribosomal protein L37AE/L43A
MRRSAKPLEAEAEYDQRAYSECPECHELRLFPAAPGHLVCRACGWEGSGVDVERDLERENSALECFLEDTRRGERGGGSKSGRSRKKSNVKGERMERIGGDETIVTERVHGPSKHVVSLPGIDRSAEFVRNAIAARLMRELMAESGSQCRLDT